MSSYDFIAAPDVYYAAAVMANSKMLIGSGDRNQIIYSLMG
jgi:hypothetical protein